MGAERRYKRQKERDVKKMYERQMRTMSTMTDEQKITHLAHLSSRIKPNNNQVQVIEPVNVV
jgi:hypothetical protein